MNKKFELLNTIHAYGNVLPLKFWMSPQVVRGELEKFNGDWKPYNSAKGDFKRWGLSITSKDGGLTGDPDLTSLLEYNTKFKTQLTEMSFKVPTPVYENVPEILPLLETFSPFLGRSHFLKFGVGGFFPYHRDGGVLAPSSFRIFVPLHCHSMTDFVFLYRREVLNLEPGRAYFINTMVEHAVFSFHPESVHLVLNVDVTEGSVKTLLSNLESF